jgi:Polyketide cyclase / dehydrase and lipid transport
VADDRRGRTRDLLDMRTWTAQKHVEADPEVVLDVLCDTDACRRWSPVPFDLDGEAGGRLAAGARVRVSGSLVGRRVGFDVEVHAAENGRLALTAQGPVAFDVAYEARPHLHGSEVHASVSLRSAGGLFGRAAEHATAALLHAGALSVAVDRIAASATAW